MLSKRRIRAFDLAKVGEKFQNGLKGNVFASANEARYNLMIRVLAMRCCDAREGREGCELIGSEARREAEGAGCE